MNIGTTAYSSIMNAKIDNYNTLVHRAEVIRRDHNNQPCKDEGKCYNEAADICEEIMNMNRPQGAVYEQWRQRKLECMDKVRKIVDYLDPRPLVEETPAPSGRSAAPAARAAAEPAEIGRTASDFTTKNAVKEVSAKMIEGWYQPAPGHSFADVVGDSSAKELLEKEASLAVYQRIREALNISTVQCYLFYGPPGTGKTFMIEAFVNAMMNCSELPYGKFKYLKLSGNDIRQGIVGVSEKVVNIAFKEAIASEPSIIFFDELDSLCPRRDSVKARNYDMQITTSFLTGLNDLKSSGARVILLGATNYPENIDEAMMDRFTTYIAVPLPDHAARAAYFERSLSAVIFEQGLTADYMAERTENYSYREMGGIVDMLKVDLLKQTIDQVKFSNEDGSKAVAAIDAAGDEAIRSGQIILTRDLFEVARSLKPPTDKSGMQGRLERFAERAGKNV